jgi:CheY-like chemotaxis protein
MGTEAKEFFYRQSLATAAVQKIYRSGRDARLMIVDKTPTGSLADALNCGVNLARFRYISAVESGLVFDADALLRAMSAPLRDPAGVVAATSHIESYSAASHGRIGDALQRLASIRALMDSRLVWRTLQAVLGTTEAVAVWRRDAIILLDGFSLSAADPDLDMMVRLQTSTTPRVSGRIVRSAEIFGQIGPRSLASRVQLATRRQFAAWQALSAGRTLDGRALMYFVMSELVTPLVQAWVLIAITAGALGGWIPWWDAALVLILLSFGHAVVSGVAVLLRGAAPGAPDEPALRALLLAAPFDFVVSGSVAAYAKCASFWAFLKGASAPRRSGMNPLALQVLIATSGVAEGWMAPSLDGRPAPAPDVPPSRRVRKSRRPAAGNDRRPHAAHRRRGCGGAGARGARGGAARVSHRPPCRRRCRARGPAVDQTGRRLLDLGEIDAATALREIHAVDSQCAVILMTGDAHVDVAISAIKAGALDYLTKPLDVERLRDVLVTVRKSIERRETFLRIDSDVARQFEFYGMVGRSPVMQELFDAIRRLAPHLRSVLITGETGTRKELVAKALHRLGARRDRRLITVNCSAVVETLFESELFGHMRGAFTGATDSKVGLFEHADHGTLFLDEVGELPLSLQAKLLRAVERRSAAGRRARDPEGRRLRDCGDQRDLATEAAAGRFRSDLYYRLGILELPSCPFATGVRTSRTVGGVHPPGSRSNQTPDRRHHGGRRATVAVGAVARERAPAEACHRAGVPHDRRPHADRARARRRAVCIGRRPTRRGRLQRADGWADTGSEQVVDGAARSNRTRAARGRRQQDGRCPAPRHQPTLALSVD